MGLRRGISTFPSLLECGPLIWPRDSGSLVPTGRAWVNQLVGMTLARHDERCGKILLIRWARGVNIKESMRHFGPELVLTEFVVY